MTRGNWQRRVESAESRRMEQRDRKARQKEETSKKSEYQKYVRHLFSMIDEHYKNNSTKNAVVLHLWLDKVPLSALKKSSYHSDFTFEQKQLRENKKIIKASNSKKGCHPRSNADFNKNNKNDDDIQYCRQYFFYAQCSANTPVNANVINSPCTQKLSSCIHHLYHVKPSLVECISLRDSSYTNSGSMPSSTALISELKLSFEAAALRKKGSNGDDSRTSLSIVDSAMNALFHLGLDFSPQQHFLSSIAINEEQLDACSEKEEGHTTDTPSVFIQKYLAAEQVSVTNIVYVVMDGKFWYDRYRGSVLLPPPSFSMHTLDSTQKASICENSKSYGNSAMEVSCRKAKIPSNLLLFIFIFLPDQYVSTLSMVCKAYAKEIASNKNLWSFLLQRRGWPTSSFSMGHTTSVNNLEGRECNHYRNSYFSHVAALTLLQTLAQNITSLVSGGGKGGNPTRNNFINHFSANNYNFLSFRATNGAPNIDDKCATLKVLDNSNNTSGNVSKNDTIKAIGAFSRDGTIRAFELTAFGQKNNSTYNTRGAVRQIASVRATPLIRNSTLVAMDMDDKFIACLCHVPCDSALQYSKGRHTVLLSVIHIEDFWCSGTPGGESIKHPDRCLVRSKTSSFFNLEVAVFESIEQQLSFHSEEAVVLRGEASYTKYQCRPVISVSPSIAACGNGNFVVHVEMLAFFKNAHNEEEGHHSINNDLKHYIAVYSVRAEAVISMHEITSSIIANTMISSPSVVTSLNSGELSCWKLMACADNSTSTTNSHRSRSCAAYIYVCHEQPPFHLVLLHVLVESHKMGLDIASVVDCYPQYITSPLSSQDDLWTCSSVLSEIMPTSRMLAIAENAVGCSDDKTIFKAVLTFHNPSNDLTKESGSCSTTARSFTYENYIVDAMKSLGDQHLLIIGRMCSGDNRENYVESSSIEELMEDLNTLHTTQRPNMRLYNSRKRQWNYFSSIIGVPSGSEIWQVQLDALHRDQSVFPSDTATFPCLIVATSNRDPCIVAIPLGLGVIMIRIGEVTYGDESSTANMESATKSKSKKKKKIVTTPNGKKDGFARGMSLH
jgi:hypothetical protein